MIPHWIQVPLRPAILSVLAVLALCSCRTETDDLDRAVASAYGEELLWSDLRQVIPFGLNATDSTALAQQFIRNWLRQRAVLHQAELNLEVTEMEFESQLRNYRNSLVIYAFEQALIQQKLDTVVHSQEMEEHHGRNGSNFELREAIMRVRWAKVRESDQRITKRLEEHFLSGETDRMHELEMWLAERGLAFIDRTKVWTTASAFRMDASLSELEGLGSTLEQGRSVFRQGDVTIFLEIMELRAAGEIAPLETVEADIRSIIINQRKLQLLERMREDLYLEALELDQIGTY